MNFNYILLQMGGAGMVPNLIFIGIIIIVFYFFMLRPQQKKAKDQKTFRENMRVGDKVVTIGGVHGKIAEFDGDLVIIDIDRGVKVTFEKTSISDELSKKYQNKA